MNVSEKWILNKDYVEDCGIAIRWAVVKAICKLQESDTDPAVLRLCDPAYDRLKLYLRKNGLKDDDTFLGLRVEKDLHRCFVMSEPSIGRFAEIDMVWKVTKNIE